MHFLASLCVRRPVFASVLVLVMCVFGMMGFAQLGVDRFPNVDIPVITITTRLPGASPAEIESQVTDKVEEAVNTVSGIEDLRSASAEGISQVFVQFVLEKDVDVAAQEVRDRVDRVLAELPADTDPPQVEKLDTDAAPVMTIALSAPAPIREISEYAERTLKRQLESVPGVGQVTLVGRTKRQINVVLDPVRMKAHEIPVNAVRVALEANNIEVPGGSLKQGPEERIVRTLGRVDDPSHLAALPVAVRGGHTIRIGDVATVEDAEEEARSFAYLNDTPSVLLNIRKQSGRNTVAVVQELRDRFGEVVKTIPDGWRAEIVRDQSVFINNAIHSVQEHLVLGSILAAIVVFFFLGNGRATIISALAIPASIISTFAIMNAFGFTLNVITLLALTLSVGIVIDDAIVVLENIYRFIDEKGMSPREAAVAATAEIGMAVMAITLSLVAVFMPIAFMTGILGRFLGSFGITMAAAIVVSMIISFTLTPMLCARWLKPAADAGTGHHPGRIYGAIENVYMALLGFSLRHRWLVVLVVAGFMASIPPVFGSIGKNFLPVDDEGDFEIAIEAPASSSIEATSAAVLRIARAVRDMQGIEYTVTTAGAGEAQKPSEGSVYVKLSDTHLREFSQEDMMQYVRTQILPVAAGTGIKALVSPVAAISGGGAANAEVQFVLGGPDTERLAGFSETIMERLRAVPAAVDVDTTLEAPKPQLGAVVNRAKAAELGVSVADAATAIRLLVAGDNVSDYFEGGEQYEVHLRAAPDVRNKVDLLRLVTVPSASGAAISLADVVDFRAGTSPAQIDRLNRKRQVTILANVAPGSSQQDVINAIDSAVKDMELGPGYSAAYVGRSRELGKAAKSFGLVFLTAIAFMYLVLAAQFESWLHPVTILLSLPLTLPFALISLLMLGESLNIFSMLGLLVLFAVVKKNSILQIDHTNHLRTEGMERNEAILAANLDRLRPILMTTVAFVAGMIPLALSQGAGSGTNHTISSVIIGGQSLSLLLTLLATPVAYSLFDDVIQFRPIHRLLAPVRWLGSRLASDPAEPPAY